MSKKKKAALLAAFLPLFTCCWFDYYHYQTRPPYVINVVGVHPRWLQTPQIQFGDFDGTWAIVFWPNDPSAYIQPPAICFGDDGIRLQEPRKWSGR